MRQQKRGCEDQRSTAPTNIYNVRGKTMWTKEVMKMVRELEDLVEEYNEAAEDVAENYNNGDYDE